MNKTIIISIIALCLVAFNSCQKTKDKVLVYYDETFCSDAWGNNDVPEPLKKNNIEAYLKSNGVKVFQIKFSTFLPEEGFCRGCGCRSGGRIESKIAAQDLEKALLLRFYQ